MSAAPAWGGSNIARSQRARPAAKNLLMSPPLRIPAGLLHGNNSPRYARCSTIFVRAGSFHDGPTDEPNDAIRVEGHVSPTGHHSRDDSAGGDDARIGSNPDRQEN